jgi:hypothetical protein
MKHSYLIGGNRVCADAAGFETAIAAAHASKDRPLCLCMDPGIPMYVAALANRHVIKRMPNTGSRHSPECESFEPPPELSGLGEVNGTAIIEDADTGVTSLKLDFSLTKTAGRAAPVATGREADTVRTDGTKLTLRGLLHYLWEEASLNRWSPAMEGKRKWYVVRKALVGASCAKSAKGQALGARLFVPETFSTEHKQEIERRRADSLAQLYTSTGKQRELMLLVGEVKAVTQARYGFKVVIKHLPDCAFMLDEQLARRMEKRFKDELALWNADESTHLIVIATFGIGAAGMLAIEEMAFMLTSADWIPVESVHDLQLVSALTQAGRRFTRGLRYNLASDRPVATAVATDTRPAPVAMYVVAPGATDGHTAALQALIEESAFPSWVWQVGAAPLPALPALLGYQQRPIDLVSREGADDLADHDALSKLGAA